MITSAREQVRALAKLPRMLEIRNDAALASIERCSSG
jgi:hypothetical protein